MKIILSVWLAASFVVLGQEAAPLDASAKLAQEKQQLSAWLPAGKKMALASFIAQGGPTRYNPHHKRVYSSGPLSGMTEAAAFEKFEKTWLASSAAVKMNWARRAMETGETVEKQQDREDKLAQAEAEAESARKAEELQRRMKKLEDAERDRQTGRLR